ncbi:hypothetical protein [Nocardia yunnanensis]|uniref:hypothetical protein n=1 Tax=Nocardia yunnanensis TaxID=2382165 RepID=UPI001FE5D159|nr:hypothetical protein [Nocardia yunnanensis]
MVLDEVWRRLDGVEPLSGPHGGPLRRTVKLILDPLVIRPVQHPQCAGAMLTADGAVLLAARVHAAADVLRAAAAWFTLLKQTRRALRITEGNAQDLYFQRCFELATVNGLPDAVRDRAAAETALRAIHGLSAGRTTQALKDYLAEPGRADELTELIHTAWRRRPLTAVPDHTAVLAELLEGCAATRFGAAAEVDLDAVIAASVGTHTGIQLWQAEPGIGEPGLPPAGSEVAACELGLTLHPLPQPPRVGVSASTATLGLPFDRTIHERVFTVLQASSERADLPPIADLVEAEIARACSPWALLDESLRAAAAAGAALAVDLRPLGDPRARDHGGVPAVPEPALTLAGAGAPDAEPVDIALGQLGASEPAGGVATRTDGAVGLLGAATHLERSVAPVGVAARLINARWQREAYVLQARRMTVRVDAVAGPLGAVAADLRVPCRPYLRRLWARLHGRDVRETPVYAADELWDLLDGVARSVILDHRMRVKRALAANTLAEPDDRESRAG